MLTDEKHAKIHQTALDEFRRAFEATQEVREQCLLDRRFYSIAGAQWEDLAKQFENKPKFEINKIHLAVIRIFNEYRNNRITVNFESKTGELNDDLAETCNGLYRADEQDSVAEDAYDNGFEEAVGGGMGAWRLRNVYEDEYDDENTQQRIDIEPIYDADTTVYWDIGSKRPDKSDAKHCWVLVPIPRTEFEDTYNASTNGWPRGVDKTYFDWSTPDTVYLAEYYRVEEQYHVVYWYRNPLDEEDKPLQKYTQEQFDADPDLQRTLRATAMELVKQKKVKRKRVHKYIMTYGGVLEDKGYIAGPNIPIVMVYGKRWVVEGIERCQGHVRLPKDAQRLKNMQVSRLGEISARSTVEKPIFTPEQIAGNEELWRTDNVKDWPYLLVNAMRDKDGNISATGPLAYTKPPDIPQALAALLQLTDADIRELLGNQEGADKIVSNISGDAVEMIQNRLDMQTFIYMSNMAKAVRRSGQIWLGMARELLVEKKRKRKVLDEQDKPSSVTLNEPVQDENGDTEYKNDLTKANFDLTVTVGPSSASRRQQTVRTLVNMLQVTQNPEDQQVLISMILMNLEGDGMEDMREYYRRKLVAMGVLRPSDEEAKELEAAKANQPPDANQQYLQSAAMNEQAKAAKAAADTELTKAKTAETLSKIGTSEQDAAIRAAQALAEAAQPPATAQPTMGETTTQEG